MRPCAIVLVAVGDAIGRAIDKVTGRSGWSHVALDPGLPDADDPVLVDIDRDEGVRLARFSLVCERRRTLVIPIAERWSTTIRRRALERIGEPYSLISMALQPTQLKTSGVYCSRIVADCLPDELRRFLPKFPSPADFTIFAGAQSVEAG